MKTRFFYYLLAAFIVTINFGCSSGNTSYNNEMWSNAFEKQGTIDTKPEKQGEFDEPFKSPSLQYIDDHYVYLICYNEYTVNIYSIKDFLLKTKFGGKGEGPSQFRRLQGFKVYPGFIFVNSPGKNSYFSKSGKLLKEVKSPPHLIPCLPVKDNFVTRGHSMPTGNDLNSPYIEVKTVLVDPGFKIKKILSHKVIAGKYTYNSRTGKKESKLFPGQCDFRIYKDRIYIGFSSMEGFYFTVFDWNGDKLYEINRPYRKRKIPDILKQAIRKKKYRQRGSNLEIEIHFYDYFPSFCNFQVADDKIYVFMYPEIDRQRVLIMDLKGKLLDVRLLPFDIKLFEKWSWRFLLSNKIHSGAKYYLRDNYETNKCR
jgi:hypothetical protein